MPPPKLRRRELVGMWVIIVLAWVGIIVSFVSGHLILVGLFGGVAGISSAFFLFRTALRRDD